MKNLDELTDFINEIFTHNYTPGYTSHFGTRRFTLYAIGGKANESVGLEIWSEDYNDTDRGDDKRQVYEIDIKVKEIRNER
jgi:hypothetical protein